MDARARPAAVRLLRQVGETHLVELRGNASGIVWADEPLRDQQVLLDAELVEEIARLE